jgi:hypothetical protein
MSMVVTNTYGRHHCLWSSPLLAEVFRSQAAGTNQSLFDVLIARHARYFNVPVHEVWYLPRSNQTADFARDR